MRPVEIELESVIGASMESVWGHLTDWEKLGKWMKEGSRFHVISSHREGLGVEAKAKIKIGPISTWDTVRVVGWRPPNRLEIEHRGWVKGTGLFTLSAQDGGTRLRWKETFVPPWGAIGAAGLRAYRPLVRRIFVRDLRLLRALAESQEIKSRK